MVHSKKYLYTIPIIFIMGLIIASCNPSTPTPAATFIETVAACNIDPVTNQPVLYGLWIMDEQTTSGDSSSLLTLTEKSVYLVENLITSESPALRESFYEIRSVDWVKSEVTMTLKWVRINGKLSGFSTPLRYMKVNIADEKLFYSLGDEGQGIPAEAKIGPFSRK